MLPVLDCPVYLPEQISRLFCFLFFFFPICHSLDSSIIFARYLRRCAWLAQHIEHISHILFIKYIHIQQCWCSITYGTSWSVCSIRMHNGKMCIEAQCYRLIVFMRIFRLNFAEDDILIFKNVHSIAIWSIGHATWKIDSFFFPFLCHYRKMQVIVNGNGNESRQIIILFFIRQIKSECGNEDVRYCVVHVHLRFRLLFFFPFWISNDFNYSI